MYKILLFKITVLLAIKVVNKSNRSEHNFFMSTIKQKINNFINHKKQQLKQVKKDISKTGRDVKKTINPSLLSISSKNNGATKPYRAPPYQKRFKNQFNNKTKPRKTFSRTRAHDITITHHELIANINGSTGFAPNQINITPINPQMGTFACTISSAYEEVRLNHLSFHFVPEIGSASTTGVVGVFGMAIAYNAMNPLPLNVTSLMSSQTSQQRKASDDIFITYSKKENILPERYVAHNPTAGSFNDFGILYYWTQGNAVTTVIGQLYVSYSYTFTKARVSQSTVASQLYTSYTTGLSPGVSTYFDWMDQRFGNFVPNSTIPISQNGTAVTGTSIGPNYFYMNVDGFPNWQGTNTGALTQANIFNCQVPGYYQIELFCYVTSISGGTFSAALYNPAFGGGAVPLTPWWQQNVWVVDGLDQATQVTSSSTTCAYHSSFYADFTSGGNFHAYSGIVGGTGTNLNVYQLMRINACNNVSISPIASTNQSLYTPHTIQAMVQKALQLDPVVINDDPGSTNGILPFPTPNEVHHGKDDDDQDYDNTNNSNIVLRQLTHRDLASLKMSKSNSHK
jgi:hypothetical protein